MHIKYTIFETVRSKGGDENKISDAGTKQFIRSMTTGNPGQSQASNEVDGKIDHGESFVP